MVLILLGLFLSICTLVGAVGGALRVRHSVTGREGYGRFLVHAIASYVGLLIIASALSIAIVGGGDPENGSLCALLCAVILSGPFMCGFLLIKAGQFIEPNPLICDACGYDMRGSPTRICPECGREQTYVGAHNPSTKSQGPG